MAGRLLGSLLGRLGSNADEVTDDHLPSPTATLQTRRSGSGKVHTLCTMKGRSSSIGSDNSTSLSSATSSGTAGSASRNSSPEQLAARPPSCQGAQQQQQPSEAAAGNGSEYSKSLFSAASDAGTNSKVAANGSTDNHSAGAPAGDDGVHDSASSAGQGSNSTGIDIFSSKVPAPAAVPTAAPQEPPAGPASSAASPLTTAPFAAADAERALSLSMGFSDPLSAANLAASAGLAAISTSAHQHSDMSFLPSTHGSYPAGQINSGSAQLQQPNSTAGSTPRLSNPGDPSGMGLFSEHQGSPRPSGLGSGLGAGFMGMQGAGGGGQGGGDGGGPSLEALVAELQATAGLTAEQAAAAAAVMMPRMPTPSAAPLVPPNPFHVPTASAHNPWAHSPPGQGFGAPPSLSPTGPMSPMSLNLDPLNPGSNPNLGAAGFMAAQAAELLGSPVAALGAVGAFGGPLMGFDSVHSSSSNNVVFGAASGLMGGGNAGGMLSPEDSYLAEAAQYAHDGLDVPGTAQVAVHNVPFKWCNVDLEDLFREQEGYLDAQLLFHENGRSKGVGVGLFRDRACAVEACNKLSGAQADGRRLELVLMNPDNHVSFSCTQVAVLGLPWEYTAADVCALLEAAAEDDNAPPNDAGVERVEVAYRDDGKSEGRAIATFGSRRQAHDAIRRLHGKETLAGLRMRLFYLHEQQQTRNQNVLAQLRTQQQLLTSLIPGMAGLAIGDPTLSPRHPQSLSPSPMAAKASRQNLFTTNSGPAGVNGDAGSNGNGDGTMAAAQAATEGKGSKDGDGKSGDGNDGGVAPAGQGEPARSSGEQDVAMGSNRSSLEKDQGPVILHVSGLMENVTREQLRELFSQAGEVTKVDIPDGGRSMGYGFITFSNPQAAEQAMLMFNNYPLGGGAIHVAYSTSATAKARQQALRQARKATLGNSRASIDGGPSRQPGTPRGMAGRGRGPGVNPFPPNPALGALGGLGGFDSLNPARHSFDAAGYGSALGGMWPRGPAGGLSPPGVLGGGMGSMMSSSLGALGSTPPGMHPAAMAQGRARRNSFEYGMGPMGGPSALQMLQGAGGNAGYPGLGGLDVSTAGNLDQQLQLLMQMTGTTGEPFGPGAGGLLGMPGGPPGTPPAGGLRTGGGSAGGLFSPPMSAPAGLGGLGGPGGLAGLSTPPGHYMGGPAGMGGFGGPRPNAGGPPGQGGGLFSPPSLMGAGGPGGMMAGAGGRMGLENLSQPSQRQVLVTGLPPGLTDGDLRSLFEICGPLRAVSKQPDQDFAIVGYDSVEHAQKAISVLDGVKLPSGSTLSLQFTTLMPTLGPDTPARTAEMPWNAASMSPAGTPGMYGAPGVHSAFATGLATPPCGSYAGEAAPLGPTPGGGGVHSGSLFGLQEAGGTGELFGGAFGSNLGGLGGSGHLGGFGTVGSGLRVGASSPAFGRPPRDGVGPAAAAASTLYSTAPIRSGSPNPGVGGARGGAAMQPGGLPPMYSGSHAGMTGSGSAGNLFGRGGGADGVGSRGSDGGSAPGSEVGIM